MASNVKFCCLLLPCRQNSRGRDLVKKERGCLFKSYSILEEWLASASEPFLSKNSQRKILLLSARPTSGCAWRSFSHSKIPSFGKHRWLVHNNPGGLFFPHYCWPWASPWSLVVASFLLAVLPAQRLHPSLQLSAHQCVSDCTASCLHRHCFPAGWVSDTWIDGLPVLWPIWQGELEGEKPCILPYPTFKFPGPKFYAL